MASLSTQMLDFVADLPKPLQIVLSCNPREGKSADREWVAAVHSGTEAEDSDMVGAAGYGVDATLHGALLGALVDFGFKEEEG